MPGHFVLVTSMRQEGIIIERALLRLNHMNILSILVVGEIS